MRFTIIIPYYDGQSTIDRLIKSIPESIEIVIVDDHSKEPLRHLDYRNVKILKAKEKGYFAGAVNVGLANTRGDVLILNQDVYFKGNRWIKQLQAALDNGYSYIGERIKGTRKDWPFGYIHGTYMYLTREVIDKVGYFNQKHFPMWGCTAEYQLRTAREGFKILPLEHVEDFVHLRPPNEQFGESFRKLNREESQNRALFVSTPPLVSVIIPTHNYSQWLHSTVNSLVGGMTDLGMWKQQTFGGFEVVIVDDSSTDNTPEIIDEVADPWKGVRSIRLDRPREEVWDSQRDKYIGKVVALNAGIKDAYGKYIMVLDADDMMKHDRIERFLEVQEQNPHGFVYDNLQLFGNGQIREFTYPPYTITLDPMGHIVKDVHPRAGETTLFPKTDNYNFNKLIHKNHVHNAIMFPKLAWQEIGGYPKRFKYGREDWAIAVAFGIKGWCGHKVGGYHGLLYRREGHNRTLENTKPNWMKYFQSQMVKEFRPIYKGEIPMGCCGNGASSRNSTNQAFATSGIESVNTEGTTLLTYQGGRSAGASFNVWGYSTGTQYRVTPGKNFRADNQDLMDNTKQKRGLLQMIEFGSPMFRVVQEEPVTETTTATDAETGTIQEYETTTLTQVETVQESDVPENPIVDTSILDGTLSVLRKGTEDKEFTETQIDVLIAYERANKNRTGAINHLEGLL